MKNKKNEFYEVLMSSKRTLEKLIKTKGIESVQVLYDKAYAEQLKKIRAAMKRQTDTFTAHQSSVILAQLHQAQIHFSKKFRVELGKLAIEAKTESFEALNRMITIMEPEFFGAAVEIPAEVAFQQAGESLLRLHDSSVAKYGVDTIRQVEGELATSLMTGETPLQAMARVQDVVDTSFYGAERIVRTESNHAWNQGHKEAIAEASDELDDLAMQWNEHCDENGQPLDKRVAVDSLAMHGQVADVGEQFFCPSISLVADENGETTVGRSLAGKWFACPPNRPNDRSVLAPWRKDWGIPGWRWNGRGRQWID
jgi:hypothetical protein